MKPTLKIGGVDYAEYVEELVPSNNNLSADGSGRDIQTGKMYITHIDTKMTYNVKLLDLTEDTMKKLRAAIKPTFYEATILDPNTNTQVTKTFYTDSISYGSQMFKKGKGKTYYIGAAFNMIER